MKAVRSLGVMAILAAIGTGAWARDLLIYEGDLPTTRNAISPGSWGSGAATEVSDRAMYGPRSIKVVTDGFYSGARLDFGKPLDLSAIPDSQHCYLVFYMRPGLAKALAPAPAPAPQPPAAQPGGPSSPYGPPRQSGPGSSPSAPASPGPSGRGGGFQLASLQVAQAPGAPTYPGRISGPPGQPTQPAAPPPAPPQPRWQITWLRVELSTEKGPVVAEMRELKPAAPSLQRGWQPISIPLSAFRGPGQGGTQVQRMIISGDQHDIFFIGQIKIAVDQAPIGLNVLAQPVVVKAGDRVNLTAQVSPGLAAVRVSWDFGGNSVVGEEATGEKVVQIYPDKGEYTVTCTVSDPDGIKKPVSGTITIKVI